MGLYWILSVRNSIKSLTPYFSGTVKARILRLGIHMDNELLNFEIENRADYSHSFFFCPYVYFRVKLCHSFQGSGAMQANIFMLGILMGTDWLYRGIETQAHCHYFFPFSPYFSFFSYFGC